MSSENGEPPVDIRVPLLLSVGIGCVWIAAAATLEPVYVSERVFTALVAAMGGITIAFAPTFLVLEVYDDR